jgi:hypothetical protein
MPRGLMIVVIEVKPLTTQIEMTCIGGSVRRRIRYGAGIRIRSGRAWRVRCDAIRKPRGLAPGNLREIETAVVVREIETTVVPAAVIRGRRCRRIA